MRPRHPNTAGLSPVPLAASKSHLQTMTNQAIFGLAGHGLDLGALWGRASARYPTVNIILFEARLLWS